MRAEIGAGGSLRLAAAVPAGAVGAAIAAGSAADVTEQ
jgi:hypothetical protein